MPFFSPRSAASA